MIHPLTWITARDHRLMGRVERWRLPRAIRWSMISATRAGDGWLWYALAVFLMFAGGEQRYRALAASTLAMGVGVAVFSSLKRICKRPRPRFAALTAPDMFSFPSGHTITAFAISVSLFHYYPAASPALLTAAAAIAASRILLGMHYPSDVAAGAVIGSALGYGGYLVIGL